MENKQFNFKWDSYLPWVIKWARYGCKYCVKKGLFLKSLIGTKNIVSHASWYEFHINLVHKWRRFIRDCRDPAKDVDAANELEPICDGSRRVLAEILCLPYESLHCTIKYIVKDSDPLEVATLSRSESTTSRPYYLGEEHCEPANENSVFASMLGISDGRLNWEQSYSFFACNDLIEAEDKFRCSREDWQSWYKSTLAFPLRFKSSDSESRYIIFGFLTFDLRTKNQFVGLPNIFKYDQKTQWESYHISASGSTVFHIGGAIADTLTALLLPYIEEDFQFVRLGVNQGRKG